MKNLRLTKNQKTNFEVIVEAARNGDLALVSTRRTVDLSSVALICAMQRNEDGSITPVPLAELINSPDPYEAYYDPTKEE